MKKDLSLEAMKNVASAAVVVRAFSASDANRAITTMLDELITSYKCDLVHVKPEELIRLQTCIQQAQAIRDVVADESQDIPKI